MYEDEYYYEARKKENAKLDAELAGTFATVIGGLIGAVLSCLIFLLRRFDVLSSGLASLLFYMLTYTREWHVAVYITVAFVIFIASMIPFVWKRHWKMPAEDWRNSSRHREECFLKQQKQT